MEIFTSLPDRGRKIPLPYIQPLSSLVSSKPLPPFSEIPLLDEFKFWQADEETHPSIRQLACLLQTWLFFGLLSEYFMTPITPLDFVVDGRVLADEARILKLLKRSKLKSYAQVIPSPDLYRLPPSEGQKLLLSNAEHQCDLIEFSADKLHGLDPKSVEWQGFAAVSLSVRLLFGRLSGRESETSPLGKGRSNPSSDLLLSNFKANGWCPVKAQSLCKDTSHRVCNYLSSLDLRTPSTKHDMCSSNCVAFDTDESCYSMPHCYDCIEAECNWVCTPWESLSQRLVSGEIPIISIKSEGSLALSVVSLAPETKYVAISHIWSEGLGNPKFNGLRSCQLNRLRMRILELLRYKKQKVGSEIQFWMDTLCVPRRIKQSEEVVESPRVRESGEATDTMNKSKDRLRSKAILQMGAVFTHAMYTLVLDQNLETKSLAEDSSTLTQFIHSLGYKSQRRDAIKRAKMTLAAGYLLGSTWMQRGWTFEEGSLGKQTVCKFGCGFVSLQDISRTLRPKERPFITFSDFQIDLFNYTFDWQIHVRDTLCKNASGVDWQKGKDYHRGSDLQSRSCQFAQAWNSMTSRSTSRKEDMAIIFANVLDFNSTILHRVPKCRRLPMVIRNWNALPLSLLYEADVLNDLDWMPDTISTRLDRGPSIMLTNSKPYSKIETERIAHIDLKDENENVTCHLVRTSMIPPSGTFALLSSGRRAEVKSLYNSHGVNSSSAVEDERTCIILHWDSKTRSPNRRSARGLRFKVISQDKCVLTLELHSTVVARIPVPARHDTEQPDGVTNMASILVGSEQFEHDSLSRPRKILWRFSKTRMDAAGRTEYEMWNFPPYGSLQRLTRRPIREVDDEPFHAGYHDLMPISSITFIPTIALAYVILLFPFIIFGWWLPVGALLMILTGVTSCEGAHALDEIVLDAIKIRVRRWEIEKYLASFLSQHKNDNGDCDDNAKTESSPLLSGKLRSGKWSLRAKLHPWLLLQSRRQTGSEQALHRPTGAGSRIDGKQSKASPSWTGLLAHVFLRLCSEDYLRQWMGWKYIDDWRDCPLCQ